MKDKQIKHILISMLDSAINYDSNYTIQELLEMLLTLELFQNVEINKNEVIEYMNNKINELNRVNK